MRLILGFFIILALLAGCKDDKHSSHTSSRQEQTALNYASSWTSWNEQKEKGNAFITDFALPDNLYGQNFSIMQDQDGSMLLANRKGIILFDGVNWKLTKIQHLPLALKSSDTFRTIFVGCKGDFGYLAKDDKGSYNYQSLAGGLPTPGEVRSVVISDEKVFLADQKTIYILSEGTLDLIGTQTAPGSSKLSGLVKINNRVYSYIPNTGLVEVNEQGITPLADTKEPAENGLLFALPLDAETTLLGFEQGNLFTLKDGKMSEYTLDAKVYIKNNKLSGGIDLSSTEYALTTLNGGCVVIDKKTAGTLATINYQTGLPDDEVHACGVDYNKGLWLSHGFGLSRINFSMPIKNFSSYPGLEGQLTSVSDFEGTLYLSTTEGVFYLQTVTSYSQIKDKVKKVEDELSIVTLAEKLDATLGIWGLKKWITPAKQVFIPVTDESEKVYALQSIDYIYTKIYGFSGKVTQLVAYKGDLLAATNTGLYKIKNKTVTKILGDYYINSIVQSATEGQFYILTDKGFGVAKLDGTSWKVSFPLPDFNKTVYSAAEDTEGRLWLGGDGAVYSVEKGAKVAVAHEFETQMHEKFYVNTTKGQLRFFTSSDIFLYNTVSAKWEEDELWAGHQHRQSVFSSDGTVWQQADNSWTKLGESEASPVYRLFSLFNDLHEIYHDESGSYWIIANNQLHKILPITDSLHHNFNAQVAGVSNFKDQFFSLKTLSFDYDQNSLVFHLSAPFYASPAQTRYRYRISSLSDEWGDWSSQSMVQFPYLHPGSYTLEIDARNVLGDLSQSEVIQFEIKKPFWATWWFRILVLALTAFAIYRFIKFREAYLLKENERLEGVINERTKEIRMQKDEIEKQRDVVLRQKTSIMDSISYASRIQAAILPTDILDRVLPEHFILFKPRDVVSGDFYWMRDEGKYTVIAAADCTGHGVPGAFMSMLGMAFLNEIVNRRNAKTPGQILDELRIKVKTSLKQNNKDSESKDGMDIAMYTIDHELHTLWFSGAHNPIYIINSSDINNERIKKLDSTIRFKTTEIGTDSSLLEIKGNSQPIGIYIKEEPFESIAIELAENDCIYTFSDGFADQTGGENGRKFMAKAFKNMFLENHKKNMSEQLTVFENTLAEWRIKEEQVDDILVMGVKYTKVKTKG